MSKIVVVGANHAGTAAINTILDNYSDNEVVVFDSNSNISFLGCGMALWIGEQIAGPTGLFYSSKEKLEEKGAKIFMETRIEKVDFNKKLVHAVQKDGTKLEESYDKIILATGSLPICPPIPGVTLQNVQFVKLYQDAESCITKLQEDEIKNVAVVGAGYIGVELAEAFERKGKNVTLIDCADTCLSKYYDKSFTDLMKNNLKDHNIKLAFGETVKEIKGETKVTSIVTDKNEYETDMVVLAIGFKPNTDLGKDDLKLLKNGAYIVDKKQETSIKDVYAIGDCATVYDNSIDDVNYIALASNAVRSGLVAGHNICGIDIESVGVQGSNGICIYDLKMVSTGLTEDTAKDLGYDVLCSDYEDLQKPGFIEKNENVKIRITYDKKTRRILGAQIASKYDISMAIHMFSLAIQEKLTIDKLKLLDVFFLPHFNQPYNYINMAALLSK